MKNSQKPSELPATLVPQFLYLKILTPEKPPKLYKLSTKTWTVTAKKSTCGESASSLTSCTIALHFLSNSPSLCGFPPFYGEDDDDAFDQIIAGKYDFPEPYWTKISDTAKDLIRKLLVVNPNKRYTAKQALEHPWIKDRNASEHLSTTLEQLKKFNAKKRWKVREKKRGKKSDIFVEGN